MTLQEQTEARCRLASGVGTPADRAAVAALAPVRPPAPAPVERRGLWRSLVAVVTDGNGVANHDNGGAA